MSTKWRKLISREFIDLMTVSQIVVFFCSLIWDYTKIQRESFFIRFTSREIDEYIACSPLALGRYVQRKYFNSIRHIKQYYQHGQDLLMQIDHLTAGWRRRLRVTSRKELMLEVWQDFRKNFAHVAYNYSIMPWIALEAWQHDGDQILTGLIKKRHLESQQDKIFRSIYRPWRKTALPRLRDKIKAGVKVTQLAREFQFLRNWNVVWYQPIDKDWVANIGPPPVRDEQIFSPAEVVRLLKPNRRQKQWLQAAPYVVFFKDYRDDVRRRQVYAWSFLFDLIARRWEVERADLGYLTLNEMGNLINQDQFDPSIIKRRKENPCLISWAGYNSEMRVIDAKFPAKYQRIIEQIAAEGKKGIVKGTVAQGGRVQGRVVIIESFSDIEKIREGDILVANTTHPNYLPALQKAAAFITNEGGIMSHAAIVARELQKPCLVGAKNATQILPDGQIAVVDTDQGTVKIIK